MYIPPYTVFDGKLAVHYGQAYVLTPECEMLFPVDAFAHQRNGLCGAAVPGGLFLTTGLHTGYVKLLVQVHHARPPVDESWDEIVEAGWLLNSGPVVLDDWDGTKVCDIPLAKGSYRVRYAARRFGEATEEDQEDDQEPLESYLLAFWPSLYADDTVLKQTSERAAYWNAGAWPTMKK
jgi:hypothetical protein